MAISQLVVVACWWMSMCSVCVASFTTEWSTSLGSMESVVCRMQSVINRLSAEFVCNGVNMTVGWVIGTAIIVIYDITCEGVALLVALSLLPVMVGDGVPGHVCLGSFA